MSEINDVYCSSRPLRISAETAKKNSAVTLQYAATTTKDKFQLFTTPHHLAHPSDCFRGKFVFQKQCILQLTRPQFSRFPWTVTSTTLLRGELIYAKINPGRGFGFV
ncbi:hypothetical protein QQ045_005327 [Rhodiola kirilowii]